MSYYTNPTWHFNIPEPAIEPQDCWGEPLIDYEEEEYDRGEDELNGRTRCY